MIEANFLGMPISYEKVKERWPRLVETLGISEEEAHAMRVLGQFAVRRWTGEPGRASSASPGEALRIIQMDATPLLAACQISALDCRTRRCRVSEFWDQTPVLRLTPVLLWDSSVCSPASALAKPQACSGLLCSDLLCSDLSTKLRRLGQNPSPWFPVGMDSDWLDMGVAQN